MIAHAISKESALVGLPIRVVRAEDLVSDSWRIDQEIMRRNAAPADPAALSVDDLILFLDSALRLAGGTPAPRQPAADHPRALI